MAFMTNLEFAEHMFKQEKRNAYTDALIKEVRRLREEIAEREMGCEYCSNGECGAAGMDYHCETTCSECRYSLWDKHFCPMCGKSLKEVDYER